MATQPPLDVDETAETVVIPPSDETGSEPEADRASGYRRPSLLALYAFLAYLALALLIWALPIGFQFASRHIGLGGGDARYYMWAFEWTPHAITNGMNPFQTDLIYAPGGVNLTWSAMIPGPAILLWPVTEAFGSLASVNVSLLLAPALASWAGFLVCRRVTGAFWPSLAGGFFVGFSSYMVGQILGHVNLVLFFPAILGVYLALRRVEGSLGAGAFIGFLALCIVGLCSISTELVATASLFGAIAFLGAWVFGGPARGRILRAGLESIVAYLLAAVVLLPILLPAISDAPAKPVRGPTKASVDLLSFVLPRHDMWLGGPTPAVRSFTSNPSEDGAYLGIVVIVMLVAFAITRWRRRETWLLIGFVGLVGLLSLGPVLHIEGVERFGLPGSILVDAPLIQHATPQRFTAYMFLPVGVIAAIWLAEARGSWAWARWAVVGLAAISLVPVVKAPPRGKEITVPRFFSDGTYTEHIGRDEIVYAIPTRKGEEMIWQAETDFRLRLAQGYIGPIPEEYFGQGLSAGLALIRRSNYMPPPKVVEKYARLHDVDVFVTSEDATPMFAELLRDAGWAPKPVEDVVVWRPVDEQP